MGTRPRNSILPAVAFSVTAHAALLAFVVLTWPREVKHLTMGAVPVTLISTQPEEAAPAPPTPEPTPSPEPTPQPETPPTPASPKPEPPKPTPPKPAPPKPEPPKPAETKTAQKVAPAKAPPARSKPAPDDSSFLTSIADAPSKTSPGARATPRAAPGTGHAAVSAGPELGALAAKITQFWRPNCQAPGADQVDIDISVRLSPQGRLLGEPKIENPKPNDPVWQAAADRAVGAAKVARYSELAPDQLRLLADEGKITLKLHSRIACAR